MILYVCNICNGKSFQCLEQSKVSVITTLFTCKNGHSKCRGKCLFLASYICNHDLGIGLLSSQGVHLIHRYFSEDQNWDNSLQNPSDSVYFVCFWTGCYFWHQACLISFTDTHNQCKLVKVFRFQRKTLLSSYDFFVILPIFYFLIFRPGDFS